MLYALAYLVQIVTLALCLAMGSCMVTGGVLVIMLQAVLASRLAAWLKGKSKAAQVLRAVQVMAAKQGERTH